MGAVEGFPIGEVAKHGAVYAELCRRARADVVITNAFRRLILHDGLDDPDLTVESAEQLPALLMRADIAGDAWAGTGEFDADLLGEIHIWLPSGPFSDLANAIKAVKRIWYPVDQTQRAAIRDALTAAGAVTGEPLFSRSNTRDGSFVDEATGRSNGEFMAAILGFRLAVREPINP